MSHAPDAESKQEAERPFLSHRGAFSSFCQDARCATVRPSTTSIGRSERQAQKGALLVRRDKHHHDTTQSITTRRFG